MSGTQDHPLDLQFLEEMARKLRIDVIDMTTRYAGHPSSCFSATEILTALYFGSMLRYRSQEPHWSEREGCILSKGHAAPMRFISLNDTYIGSGSLDELMKKYGLTASHIAAAARLAMVTN